MAALFKKATGLLIFTLFFYAQDSFAWGGRGHDSICQASVHLVQNENLKEFLKRRPHIMSHLCNTPDIHWRSLKGTEVGNATHYIEPDLIGLDFKDFPLQAKGLLQFKDREYKDKANFKVRNPMKEFGTLWWRAEQFVRLAITGGQLAKKSKPPKDSREEQNQDLPFNQGVYEFMVNLGLLGHFVGDGSQPLHNTADYDGWGRGHGGLHSWFEDTLVSAMDENLIANIVKEAKKPETAFFLKQKTSSKHYVVESMRELSVVAYKELDTLYKNDELVKKSEQKEEKGMKLKKPAERVSVAASLLKQNDLIILSLARASLTLAKLWDYAYEQSGRPDLSGYRSFQYPLSHPFIEPDYYQEPNR